MPRTSTPQDIVWLLVHRPDGSRRGRVLVAKPEVTPVPGGQLQFSFGDFLIGDIDEDPDGYTQLSVTQRSSERIELWDFNEAPEFRGRIDMMAA